MSAGKVVLVAGVSVLLVSGLAGGVWYLTRKPAAAVPTPVTPVLPPSGTSTAVPVGQQGSSIPALPVVGQTIAVGEPFTPAGSAPAKDPVYAAAPVYVPAPIYAPAPAAPSFGDPVPMEPSVPFTPAGTVKPLQDWLDMPASPVTPAQQAVIKDVVKNFGLISTMPIFSTQPVKPAAFDTFSAITAAKAYVPAASTAAYVEPKLSRGEIRAEYR